jgi:pseudouridine-5'-phosphate glycosidase
LSSFCSQEQGVTPATIAVMDGVGRIGLTPDELQDLAKAGEEKRAQKCSTRELSLVLGVRDNQTNEPHQWGGTDI